MTRTVLDETGEVVYEDVQGGMCCHTLAAAAPDALWVTTDVCID